MNPAKFDNLVCGRKFCSHCNRWRVAIDFPVHTWADKEKTRPERLQSWCHTCRRVVQRPKRRVENMTRRQHNTVKLSQRTYQRKLRREAGIPERVGGAYVKGQYKRSGSVDREPFVRWVRGKMVEYRLTVHAIAPRLGFPDPAMLSRLLRGYDNSGRRVRGRARKLRPIDFIELETVDRALQEWGTPWVLDDLYPSTNGHEEPLEGSAA